MAECVKCGTFILFKGGLCTECFDKIYSSDPAGTTERKEESKDAQNNTNTSSPGNQEEG